MTETITPDGVGGDPEDLHKDFTITTPTVARCRTAAEIREIFSNTLAAAKNKNSVDAARFELETHNSEMLTEIAAQLAEVNHRLAKLTNL